MGRAEHDFIFDFVKFLISQHLAEVNFSDFLIDLVDRDMTPAFIAPLTTRGRRLVRLLQAEDNRLVAEGDLPDGGGYLVAQEAFVEIVSQSYGPRMQRLFCSKEPCGSGPLQTLRIVKTWSKR